MVKEGYSSIEEHSSKVRSKEPLAFVCENNVFHYPYCHF